MGNDLLLEAYRRAGIQVEAAPVPVEVEPAGDPQGLTESELHEIMIRRAGIFPAKPEDR